MIRHRIILTLILATAFSVLFLTTLPCMNGVATSAPPNSGSQTDSAKALQVAVDAQAQQLKDLQKQVADLQTRISQKQTPRIVAAGTATIKLPGIQDNKQTIRVKLPADIAARLGADCIVQLTNRCPTGGCFFVPYWKPTGNGFDILVADPSLEGVQIVPHDKEPYYIDWVVVGK
jgi:hypothetical protein